MVVTRGDPELPERVFVGRFAAGLVASSYQAEVLALREALVWLSECESAWESAAIVSDSQAALRAMRDTVVGVGWVSVALGELVQLGKELGVRGKRLVFVWVPGHCGLVGNECA